MLSLSTMGKELDLLQAVKAEDIRGITRLLAKYKSSKPNLNVQLNVEVPFGSETPAADYDFTMGFIFIVPVGKPNMRSSSAFPGLSTANP
ncbi:hypothetical protein CDAR_22751 [Caerostris darwini]|uniref:Uncharacterized protein n=1 Tax=Caerostris darwini TaxID=1538125 RepID=A0AAV4S3W6_9ARAC|nr:hypothetical protein CDAR_22751 [Caerostris darwini]